MRINDESRQPVEAEILQEGGVRLNINGQAPVMCETSVGMVGVLRAEIGPGEQYPYVVIETEYTGEPRLKWGKGRKTVYINHKTGRGSVGNLEVDLGQPTRRPRMSLRQAQQRVRSGIL